MRAIHQLLQRPVIRGWAWLLALPAILVSVDQFDVTYHMETMTLAPSQETWRRQLEGEERAWQLPSLYGRERINKPPLTVWANMIAWSGLDLDTPTDTLVARSRYVAIFLSMLTILGVGWAGRSLGNRRVANLSMLVLGVMLLFMRQSRVATYDIYLLAFCTMSVAAGWHALRRGTTARGRITAWIICGICMGLAALSKGPIAYLFSLVPIVVLLVCDRATRKSGWYGAGVAALISAVLFLPWLIHVSSTVSSAGNQLLREYRAVRSTTEPSWYYIGLLGLVFPWTLWFVGGIAGYFPLRRNVSARFHVYPPIAWFLFILVVMSIPDAKNQRYILPILPSAALIIARSLLYLPLKSGRRSLLVRSHYVLLGIGTAAYAVIMIGHNALVHAGFMKQPQIAGLSPSLAIMSSLALASLVMIGWRMHGDGRRTAAAMATGLWMAVAALVGFHGYAQSPARAFATRADAEKVDQYIGESDLYYYDDGRPWFEVEPDQKFLLYSRRAVRRCTAVDLARSTGAPAFVMAEDIPGLQADFERAGYARDLSFPIKKEAWILWRRVDRE